MCAVAQLAGQGYLVTIPNTAFESFVDLQYTGLNESQPWVFITRGNDVTVGSCACCRRVHKTWLQISWGIGDSFDGEYGSQSAGTRTTYLTSIATNVETALNGTRVCGSRA